MQSLYHLPQYRPWAQSAVALVVVMLFVLLGGVLATQYVAWRMAYGPQLGQPLFGTFYPPYDYFIWLMKYSRMESVAPLLTTGGLICAGCILAGALIGYFASWNARRTLPASDIHGSARWAGSQEVQASGLIRPQGVFLGEWQAGQGKEAVFLRHDGPEHVLVFAPTRSGKGVGFVIPTLLEWQESVVVYDIKGENWAMTAGWRAAQGHHVLKFEPTAADGSSLRWNPLLEIRMGDSEVRDAQNISDILVDPDGDGELDHWQKSARTLLTAAILHVLYTRPEKTLREVALVLSDPVQPIEQTLQSMLTATHDPDGSRGWKNPDGSALRTHPTIQATAREMLDKSERERSSIVSTAVSCLTLFRDDPVIARNTAVSDFMVKDLMHRDVPVSLYLVVPPSDISRTRVLMRLALNLLGRKLTEKLGGYKHSLLLLLDEFPTLGRLEFFQDALAYLAGYGIKAMLIAQDLSQLYKAYGERESIISNCHVRVALTPNKVETAELISRMSGVQTVLQHSRNISGRRTGWMLANISEGLSEVRRPLMTADEVLRLPPTQEMVFVAGHHPILATRFRYYEHEEFARRSRIPAPTETMRLDREGELFPTIPQAPNDSEASEEDTLPEFAVVVADDEEDESANMRVRVRQAIDEDMLL